MTVALPEQHSHLLMKQGRLSDSDAIRGAIEHYMEADEGRHKEQKPPRPDGQPKSDQGKHNNDATQQWDW